MWIMLNVRDDSHDGALRAIDAWLQTWVPQILFSPTQGTVAPTDTCLKYHKRDIERAKARAVGLIVAEALFGLHYRLWWCHPGGDQRRDDTAWWLEPPIMGL